MDDITERNNLNNWEIDDSNYWNISYTRNNRISSKRKLARFIASLICQTIEIENKLEIFAEQKCIPAKEEESIKESCVLYEQMLDLLKKLKNLYFQNLSDRHYTSDPWRQKIVESPNRNIKLII